MDKLISILIYLFAAFVAIWPLIRDVKSVDYDKKNFFYKLSLSGYLVCISALLIIPLTLWSNSRQEDAQAKNNAAFRTDLTDSVNKALEIYHVKFDKVSNRIIRDTTIFIISSAITLKRNQNDSLSNKSEESNVVLAPIPHNAYVEIKGKDTCIVFKIVAKNYPAYITHYNLTLQKQAGNSMVPIVPASIFGSYVNKTDGSSIMPINNVQTFEFCLNNYLNNGNVLHVQFRLGYKKEHKENEQNYLDLTFYFSIATPPDYKVYEIISH